MSSYANFYLRVNDLFVPIGSWSRSSELYQAIHSYCPYEKIRAFSTVDLKNIIEELEEKENRMKKLRKADENRCQMIMQANNSIDEKLEAISNIESNFEEIDDYIKEITFAINTLQIFCDMIEDFHYSDKHFSNDYEHYIYAGIEAAGELEEVVNE